MKNIFGWLLLVLASGSSLIAQNENKFEAEIQAFEQADLQNPPVTNGILFLGSSSIKRWTTLAQDYEGYPVLNRGFGGSQCSDAIYFFDRVVKPYLPAKIAFYEGDNDLASGKTPEQVLADFKAFVKMVKDLDPSTRIAFISIKPSVARWELVAVMKRANQLVKDYCELDDAQLTYIDVFSPMLNDQQEPQPELFVEDQLHMNAKGYAIWKTALESFVME